MNQPIPSPPGLPFVGNLLDMRDEEGVTIHAFERLADIYGPIYRLRFRGAESIIVVSSAELFDELCDETRFSKVLPPALAALNKASKAQGLITVEHETTPDWQQAHRILMPAFGPLAIENMFDEMVDIASQLVLKWARMGPGFRIPATEDFTRLTLDTLALCTMGFRFNSFYQDEMHPFVVAMNNTLGAGKTQSILPETVQQYVYSTANTKLQADRDLQNDTAMQLVTERREHPTDKKDLLNTMINGKDPKTGETMRDELITANMVTFLVAGHETTSGLLSFVFCYLLKNPAAYFKAQEEVDRVVGKAKITSTHLKKFDYLNAVLRETLRLSPTAPAFARGMRRESKEAYTTLGRVKYRIEKNSRMVCLIPKIQRDPKIWGEDANEFKPERMLGENFDNLPKSAWKPFGTGLRSCIGRAFAWQEALTVTALLLQHMNFRLDDPSYELKIKQTLTIKPRDFYMRATLRDGMTPTQLQEQLSSSTVSAPTENVMPNESPANAPQVTTNMTVAYGSTCGTCQTLAQRLASEAPKHGYIVSVVTMDSLVQALPKRQPVVLITSSYEGEPPDNAAQFVAWLQTLNDVTALDGLNYSVFGCGHSDWSSTYQRIPLLVDEALDAHGGKRLTQRGSSDVKQGDTFGDFDAWADKSLWPAIITELGTSVTTAESAVQSGIKMEISSQDRATKLRQDVKLGRVLSVKTLTAPGEPEKRHLEIQLPSDLTYQPGDYLAILPFNPFQTVRRVLSKYSLPWDAVITISDGGATNLPTNVPISAFDLLKGYVELEKPATRKDVQKCVELASSPTEKAVIEGFIGKAYHDYIIDQRVSVLELIERFPSIQLPFNEFLNMLPPMQPRQYSLSSSPLQDASICTITYGIIDEESFSGHRRFTGVAGSYLRSLRDGDQVQVSVRSTSKYFRLPAAPETPIVMFCAGTGLAPFRGFVQQRAIQLAASKTPLPPALLFIGCRSRTQDRLYAEEFDAWAAQGAVDVRYAFSRDADASHGCKYIQDRLLKDGEDFADLWQKGAKVFICGSSSLAQEIGKASRKLLQEKLKETGKEMTDEEVDEWFKERKNERFATDVFQ